MKIRILLIIYSINLLLAVDAMPGLITHHQPDGTPIQCDLKGDEWANWHETTDGWSIAINEDDVWMYAEGINGRLLIPGSRVVGQDAPPLHIEKHLTPIPEHRPIHSSNVNLHSTRTDTFHVPVIYFQFPDMAVTYPISDIDNIFNQEGYGHPGNPGSGSFREFYEEISYGQFSPVSQVVGVFTAPHNHDYYGNDQQNSGTRQRQLMRAMVDSAEASGVDWTVFDNDGDGDVDCVTLVHAGQGAEQGNGSNIWSHRWSLGGSNAVTYDGVLINDYNVNPEIQGTGIVAIGVIAHEFGHALGLPDLYDTDYTSSGSGKLALMASGSWGTTGNTPWYPSAMNAWCKTEMGWSNVITISSAQTNVELEQSYTNNTIYRVDNPEDNSEYWLIENRQKKGTDNLMPQPGLLFWHIDTEKTDQGWAPNNDEPHYGVGLEQADGLFELENDGASDRGDPFPGLTENHEFTHCTMPSTESYYYEPSMVAFTNISYADSIMTFEVSFDDIATGTMSAIGFGDAYAVGYLSISMANSVTLNELSFELSQHPNILLLESINVSGRASADSIIVTNNFIELVNPVIPAGSGEILMLTVFANTGSDGTVNVSAEDVTANDANGNMVCFTFDESAYLVNTIVQGIAVDSATAFPGETAPVYIDLHNSIPIRMIIATINTSHPNRLYPVAETYVDANNNGTYDQGENFFDINNDGFWTPAVQPTDRTANWDFSYQINDAGIIVAGMHTIDTIAIGTGPIFQINYMVNSNAPAGNVSLILANVNLADMFGNYNLQYTGTNGVFIISLLSTGSESIIPEKFSMSANYPNPFNPVTHVNFDVPNQSNVTFTIYSLLGQKILSVSASYEPGSYKFTWNGRDQLGNELSSGVYLLKMETENFLKTRKLVLMK